MLDNITTYALLSKGSHPGLSVDMYITFLKEAKLGDNILVDARTVKAGKNIAHIECELRHEEDGSIIAKGGQTKYILQKCSRFEAVLASLKGTTSAQL